MTKAASGCLAAWGFDFRSETSLAMSLPMRVPSETSLVMSDLWGVMIHLLAFIRTQRDVRDGGRFCLWDCHFPSMDGAVYLVFRSLEAGEGNCIVSFSS